MIKESCDLTLDHSMANEEGAINYRQKPNVMSENLKLLKTSASPNRLGVGLSDNVGVNKVGACIASKHSSSSLASVNSQKIAKESKPL
jgi:hypothetical protein